MNNDKDINDKPEKSALRVFQLKSIKEFFFISLIILISIAIAFNQLNEFKTTRIKADFTELTPVKTTILGNNGTLPYAYRVPTYWFIETVSKYAQNHIFTGVQYGEIYSIVVQKLFFIVVALIIILTAMFLGTQNVWSYLAILSTFYILRMHDLEQIRLTDFPSILFTTIVFGLSTVYYLNAKQNKLTKNKALLAGLFLFSALGSIVRESIILSAIFLIVILMGEFYVLAKEKRDIKYAFAEIRGGGLWLNLSLGILAVLCGIIIGKVLLFLAFPELRSLPWQQSLIHSPLKPFLGKIPKQGSLFTDMILYLPGNIIYTHVIFINFFKQYIFVLAILFYMLFFAKKKMSKTIAFATGVIIFLNFSFYYLFGGILGEGFAIMSLISGLNVPLFLSLKNDS